MQLRRSTSVVQECRSAGRVKRVVIDDSETSISFGGSKSMAVEGSVLSVQVDVWWGKVQARIPGRR